MIPLMNRCPKASRGWVRPRKSEPGLFGGFDLKGEYRGIVVFNDEVDLRPVAGASGPE